MSSNIMIATDETFESIVTSGNYLVDFYSQQCQPCKQMDRILQSLTISNLTVVKVDVSANPIITSKHHVRGVPTFILYKDGIIQDTKSGSIPQSQFIKWLEESLV